MRPGKKLTPIPTLDLEKLWRALKEEPPGAILTLKHGEPKEAGPKIGKSSN